MQMMYCPNCGKRIDSAFCTWCGTPAPTRPTQDDAPVKAGIIPCAPEAIPSSVKPAETGTPVSRRDSWADVGRSRLNLKGYLPIALVGFCLYLYFSPYLFIRDFRKYLLARDGGHLAELIDFQSVRSSLKESVKPLIAAAARKDAKQGDEYGPLGAAIFTSLANAMIDPLIDNLVTPKNLNAWLSGSDVATTAALGKGKAITGPQNDKQLDAMASASYSTEYTAFSAFVIKVSTGSEDIPMVQFTLRRDNWVAWKLVGRFHGLKRNECTRLRDAIRCGSSAFTT